MLSTRRAAAAPQLLLALLLSSLLLLASPASGSLMSIDLGAENLRAVLVKPSGRGNPLQIVVNEMSRRKSPALVGLAGEDRLLGEEALSFAIRYPTTVFSRVRDLLGRSAGDAFVQNMLKSNALPYEVVDHPERKTAMLKVNETTAYLAEELAVRGYELWARRSGAVSRSGSGARRARCLRCARCLAAAGAFCCPASCEGTAHSSQCTAHPLCLAALEGGSYRGI